MILEKEIKILPTHSCFDDCSLFIVDRFTRMHITFLNLCHGLCIDPEGKKYSHAWIMNQEQILDFGIVDGEKVLLKYKRSEFFQKLNVQWFREYKLSEGIASEYIAKMPGPWDNELRALCRDNTPPIEIKRHKLLLLFGRVWKLK
jgi:hypothetical protein